MEKLRVLFVDDEAAILESIRDLLRKDRHRWDLNFALGGEAALAAIRESSWDVVVTDMRMPGMSGAEVLEEVKRLSPHTTRVVLSGHSVLEAIRSAIPVAHQYLAKPCSGDTLRALLQSSEDLVGVMSNPELRRVAGGVGQLPASPALYQELTIVASDPSKGTADLAAVLERDPAMSAKVLQVVNSAYFGLARQVSSVQQAAAYLGMETLKGLALAQSVLGGNRRVGAAVQQYQQYSFAAASMARSFLADSKEQGEAYTAGIVHEIGRLVLLDGFPKRYKELLKGVKGQVLTPAVERAEWGASHAEVGAYLLGAWGLPPHLVAATAFHHEPSRCRSVLSSESSARVLGALHVAAVLAGSEADQEEAFDQVFLLQTGLSGEVARWSALGRKYLESLRKGGKGGV